ncbi:MAG: DUF885 domain-containing protein [Bacilli bacterium]
MRKIKRYLLTLLIVFIFAISGCSGKTRGGFDAFTEQLFLAWVASPLDANFLVKDAEAFGFDELEVEPLSFSKEEHEAHNRYLEEVLEELRGFNYKKLDAERKLTYRVLEDYLESELAYADFYHYATPLGSYLGYQARLPLLLSEYHFYTKRDIENYFAYLETAETSFRNILAFEKEKAANGFGMNDRQIEGIIKQCRDFLSPKDNFLLSVFESKLRDLDYLSLDEKNLLTKKHRDLIENKFLPAYEFLANELETLKGRAKNNRGLAHFERGREYYQLLFREATGTKMEVPEAYAYLERKFSESFSRMQGILLKRPDLLRAFSALKIFPDKSYEEIYSFFAENCAADFPGIGAVEVRIENIHASLEENSSPAMYFLSPIDAEVTEVIYVNGTLFRERSAYAFFTLAHESIPGHLLQHTVLKNGPLPKIRKLLGYSGYAEGWATYAETYVGKYLEMDQDLLALYHLNDELTYVALCLADIGINYHGWSLAEFEDFIGGYFSMSASEVEDLYYRLIEVASNYLEYYFGYYQLLDLKEKFFKKAAKHGLDSDYHFHEFYLQTGPAPFYILEEEIDGYLKSRSNSAFF